MILGMNECKSAVLDSFEEEKAVLPDVEVDVVVGLVGDIAAEVPADEGVPVPVVLAVQLILEVRGDLLDGVHLVQRVLRDCQNLGLHLRTDVLPLNHRLLLPRLSHQFQI